MYYKIEKSGCCERNGMLQIRMDIYDENVFTDVPIIPEEGYTGKVDEKGMVIDEEDYKSWFASLPVESKNLPIQIHFFYLDHDATEEDITAYADKMLGLKEDGEDLKNDPVVWKPENKALVEARLASVKTADFEQIKSAKLNLK